MKTCTLCGKKLGASNFYAAPVAEMVRQLDVAIEADDQEAAKNTGFTEELDDALRALDLRGMRTALLARLGQGWIPSETVIEIDEDGNVHPEGVNLKGLRHGASDD